MIHTYIHTYIHTQLHTYIDTSKRSLTRRRKGFVSFVTMYKGLDVCMYVCIRGWMDEWIGQVYGWMDNECIKTPRYIHTHIHTYIHTYIHTSSLSSSPSPSDR